MTVSLPIAFISGLASFFAPCLLPLLPAYIAYVTGVSLNDLKTKGYPTFRKKIIIASLFYVLGFSLVFVALGTLASTLGGIFYKYNFFIHKFLALIILILGLQFADFLKFPFLAKQFQFKLPPWFNKFSHLRSFFIGIIFAASWTPCVGPVLGAILALAAVSNSIAQGAFLLFIYSLGISLPFLAISLTISSAPIYLTSITKYTSPITKAAGFLLALLGLYLLIK